MYNEHEDIYDFFDRTHFASFISFNWTRSEDADNVDVL